jgi:peptidyl-prolyl cis-trans isomerase A (cyclophilin A)
MKQLRLALLALCLALPFPAAAQKAPPGTVRVRLVTSAGAIVLAIDARHAPKTAANFLAYVDDGRFEGTQFYRAARTKADPKRGFIQGGVGTDYRRILPSPPLEPTSQTGLHHVDGTVSMARGAAEDSATGNFSLMVGANPGLDARGGDKGYAAFGRVLSGMDVVKRILAMPTSGGRGAMKGQMLDKPVDLIRAERLDGTPKPTSAVKPWLIGVRH